MHQRLKKQEECVYEYNLFSELCGRESFWDKGYDAISEMIDSLCDMSNVLNASAEKAGE